MRRRADDPDTPFRPFVVEVDLEPRPAFAGFAAYGFQPAARRRIDAQAIECVRGRRWRSGRRRGHGLRRGYGRGGDHAQCEKPISCGHGYAPSKRQLTTIWSVIPKL